MLCHLSKKKKPELLLVLQLILPAASSTIPSYDKTIPTINCKKNVKQDSRDNGESYFEMALRLQELGWKWLHTDFNSLEDVASEVLQQHLPVAQPVVEEFLGTIYRQPILRVVSRFWGKTLLWVIVGGLSHHNDYLFLTAAVLVNWAVQVLTFWTIYLLQ